MEENLWSEGGYIKSINTKDPEFKEKMKYFEEKPDDPKEHNCKKCNKAIGKHNVYWHEGMCNNCFFDEYNMNHRVPSTRYCPECDDFGLEVQAEVNTYECKICGSVWKRLRPVNDGKGNMINMPEKLKKLLQGTD